MNLNDYEVVWLTESRTFAFLEHRGAHVSTVFWLADEVAIFEIVENNEYVFWKERAIEFESDE
jgi:hypothetical protein